MQESSGDTGRFLYPSTTSRTLEIASILRNYPFDASALNREIEQMPMKVAKLSGYLYQNIQVDENGAGRIILRKKFLINMESMIERQLRSFHFLE